MNLQDRYYALKIKELESSGWTKPSVIISALGLIFSISIAVSEKIKNIELEGEVTKQELNIADKSTAIDSLTSELKTFRANFYEACEAKCPPSGEATEDKVVSSNITVEGFILEPEKEIKLDYIVTPITKKWYQRAQRYEVILSLSSKTSSVSISDLDSVTYQLEGFSGANPIIDQSRRVGNFEHKVTAFNGFPVTVLFKYKNNTYSIKDNVTISL